MFGAYIPNAALGRLSKITISISLAAALAACSSASERFGPYKGKYASKDPGFERLPNMAKFDGNNNSTAADSEYTASIDRRSSDVAIRTQKLEPISSSAPRAGFVTVKPGDTLYSLSRANGTTVDQMVSANNLSTPYVIKPGQSLRIPGKSLVSTYKASAPQPSSVTYRKSGRYSRHEVLSGESVSSIANLYGLKTETIGRFNDLPAPYKVSTGQVLKVPYSDAAVQMMKPASVAPKTTTRLSSETIPVPVSNPLRAKTTIKSVKVASIGNEVVPLPVPKPTYVASIKQPTSHATPAKKQPVKLVKPEPRTSSKFRWPVKGRIISQYGTRPNGTRNDGINIAVPLGTSVKAAENGVVTYAGNELQGYGNLVIISHADKWVTLYAHNDKILVKKGQVVKRGQIISKAGKTGQVSNPQVHFEIRKGAQVVNPVKYMSPAQYAGIR